MHIMMTVNNANACRPPAMPQEHRRRSCDEYDVISSDFPPPSLKPANSPDQDKKKKKKWSIGGLFRRKKKVSDTDSSSPLEDEEEKKGFLERRRARKRRNRGSKDVTGSFEAVIINQRQSQMFDSNLEVREISNDRVGRSHESLPRRETNHVRGSSVSLEGVGRKGGRLQVKARVEESRERLRGDSSSDEAGGSSKNSSSSVQRLKGDESVSKDGSLSRRSRAARTERYKKRLSKDDESLKDFRAPSRISRSDERLSNKKVEKPSNTNRWTAKVVYYESSDYDTKYTAITKSATPSPIQSPKARPKNALHYTNSAPLASNYVTYPPSHGRDGVVGSHQELRSHHYPIERFPSNQRYPEITPPRLPKSNSDLITKPAQLPNSIQRHYPSWGEDALNRKSASYDCNVNSIHHVNSQISQPHPTDANVLVVQFPLSRPTQKVENKVKMGLHSLHQSGKQLNPPPPPPRDPHRRLVGNGYQHESSPRPMSYAFEDRSPVQPNHPGHSEFGSSSSAFQRVPQSQPIPIDFEPIVTMNRHQRSISDNHIPSRTGVKQSPPTSRRIIQPENSHRTHQGSLDSYASSPPSDHTNSAVPCHYQYYTDQQPRSRKPIHISYQNQKNQNDPYLSDSQVIVKPPLQQQVPRTRPPGVQNAADFWKQKDQESAKKIHISEGSPKLIQRHLLNLPQGHDRSRSKSPLRDGNVGMVASKPKLPPLIIPGKGTESSNTLNRSRDNFTSRTPIFKRPVHNEIGIPYVDSIDLNSNTKRPLSMLVEKQETSEQDNPAKGKPHNPPTPPKRTDSKVNAVTNFEHFDVFSDSENKNVRRKSSNLEEALNELEAIYKSLRLGEDSYLEKVAKEQAVYENNRLDPTNWNAWVQSRGFESDSSFNYSRSSLESVDSVDSPIKGYNSRRSGEPDRVTDDMAYRRLNKKDRPSPHEQEVLSQAGSFLLVSPTLSPPPFIDPHPVPQIAKEPDVEKDDVVYRNIKHVNNTLKCLDPQPPFGIPLGPITPAPNSDYLHVYPKETSRPTFKPRKIPDVVTDDLAFRNLRKDNNKEPLITAEDNVFLESPTTKKKRAVRSLSANLLSIIQRESLSMKNNNNKFIYNNNSPQVELEKSQSFTDVNDAFNIKNGSTTNGHVTDQHQRLIDLNFKKGTSGEDSDVTPRASRAFSIGTSSPLTATSTETLTGSKNSLCTPDSKSGISKLSKSPSPRLSCTPERRHTTDNITLFPLKSISPSKYHTYKSDAPKNTFSASYPKSDFHRSPSPENITLKRQNNSVGEHTQHFDQNESDLLAILAKEAKEASEQLSKELNNLNFENNLDHINTYLSRPPEIKREQAEKKDSGHVASEIKHSQPRPLGKIIPHKPVKLNTFVITENDKLESKQIDITDKSTDIEGSKSMTDLLKELTRSLDMDFGNSTKDADNQICKTEVSEKINNNEENRLKNIESNHEDTVTDEQELNTTGSKECEDKYFSSHEDISDERFSSPEKFLQSFVAEAIEKQKGAMKSSTSLTKENDQNESYNLTKDTETYSKRDLEPDKVIPDPSCFNEEGKDINEGSVEVSHPSVITTPEEDLEELHESISLLKSPEQESTEVDEVLNTLNGECSKQNEQPSPTSSPLPKKFPLEFPQDEVVVEENSLKYDISSHSSNEIESFDLLTHARATDQSSPPGTSRESRVVAARPRDCIDCPRMTDEGTKTMADPGTLLLVCMACANLLAGLELDFLTIFGLVLAIACLFLFLVL